MFLVARRSDGRCSTNSGTSEMRAGRSHLFVGKPARNTSNDTGIKFSTFISSVGCDPQVECTSGWDPSQDPLKEEERKRKKERGVWKYDILSDSQGVLPSIVSKLRSRLLIRGKGLRSDS